MTRLATEETQIIVHAMLSLFLSEPTIFPELWCRGRGWLWSTSQSSRGESASEGTRVGQIFVTGVLVGQGSRSLALIFGLTLCPVYLCFTSNFIVAFPVVRIDGLSECTEAGKVVRFTYSGNLILDLGQKSIELTLEWCVSLLDTCS